MTQSPPFDPIAFLQALIRIPSADPPGGELAVAARVAETLAGLGIAAELDEFAPGRANVLGRIPGRGERAALVFSAHMDTVPAGESGWSFDPFAGDVVDGSVRGRGAADMKSALAAFVGAAEAISRRRTPLAGDVILAFSAGESANCIGAKRFVERGLQAEIGAFLCGEPSGLDLIVVEKAALWIDAVAQGRLGHVSGDAGVNAIALMVAFLNRVGDLALDAPPHPLLSPPTLRVGRIDGGTAVNVTPDRCRAALDARFSPGVAPEAILEQIRAIAPDGVALAVADFKPAIETAPDSGFVRTCAGAATATTGREPAVKGVSYFSDGAVLLDGRDGPLDAPFAIIGPGVDGMSGQADESVRVDDVLAATRIYRRIAEDWLE